MRILINAVSARAGGGVSYLINLLQILPRICPENIFLAAIPDIKLPVAITSQSNLEIQVIKEASGNVFQRYLWENTGLINLCKSWQADLLYCVANIIPLRNPGIPVVVMIQNVAPLTPRALHMMKKYEPVAKYLQLLLLQKLTLFATAKSSSVIALSEATAALLQHWLPDTTSSVLYHGIASTFSPEAKRPVESGDEPYFLYVSNLYVYKGLEYIIEAMAHDRSLPRIFIAGKPFDTGYMKMIKELITQRDLNKRVIFLDAVPYNELPGWYAHATAMVYASWCENCPNILLEAMACGCPVVAMNIGPMPEICGHVGYYAEPFNPISLAAAMNQALSASYASVKSLSIRRAAEFTWEKSMQQHVQIFADAAKPGRKNSISAR